MSRICTLEHSAGGQKRRECYADEDGIWVDWNMAGRYQVTKTPKAKSFRFLKAIGAGGGWYLNAEDMRCLLEEHNKIRGDLKKKNSSASPSTGSSSTK